MRPLQISLPPELEGFIAQQIQTGALASAEEVIRNALQRVMNAESSSYATWKRDVEEKLVETEAAVARREIYSVEEVKKYMQERKAEWLHKQVANT